MELTRVLNEGVRGGVHKGSVIGPRGDGHAEEDLIVRGQNIICRVGEAHHTCSRCAAVNVEICERPSATEVPSVTAFW